ncbi:4Fe-4S dicluster domain-containing protein [Bacillus sp. 1P06AnD]|uniref:4Fe-4S dicluster domain-containing protein n=1 Tax=Bacillus sp. 1P06AnD TaxID=3132208 RepID=UPI0039A0FB8A
MGIVGLWAESLDYQYEIDETTCVRHKSPFSTCNRCTEVCLEQAIEWDRGKPSINRELCTECGKCLANCSVQAIAGIYPKRKVWNGELIVEPQSIPSAKEMLIYYAKGIHSAATEQEAAEKELVDSLEEANSVLLALGKEPIQLKMGATLPDEQEKTYSRRDLFSLWKTESQSIMKEVTPAKWRFNQMDFELAKHYKETQFYHVEIDPLKCSLCKICESLCVKECFRLSENQFTISPHSCADCRLCMDTCPEGAIHIQKKISNVQPQQYHVFDRTCTSCKKEFKTLREDDRQCFVCQKRKAGYLSS